MRRLSVPLVVAILVTLAVAAPAAAAFPTRQFPTLPPAARRATPHPGRGHRVTPTATALPKATAPETPTLAATLTATLTATATAPATATVQAVDGIPVCTGHDPTKWHALVERNADGSIACTYTHEHKDNPHTLDSILGPLPVPEISYPWMTSSALGAENDAKHRVYAWQTVQVDHCAPSFEPYGFDAIRLEVHQDGNGGATTRYHSYWVQARTCDPNDPTYHGTLSIGGHLDFGYLYIDCPGLSPVRVPVPADSSGPAIAELTLRRLHGGTTCDPSHQRYDATWYGRSDGGGALPVAVNVGIRSEDWGPIDASDPTQLHLYGGTQNGSWQEPVHVLDINLGPWLDTLDGVQDGVVTYDGYVDRSGNIVQNCSAATLGPDCVPVHLDHVKIGAYQFRADHNGIATREYDVTGLTGQSLITYLN